MSNVVKFSINGDTNAEQVADRAKKAVSGFDKQIDGIGNKFKTSFKDIFLSFLGPMALLTGAMALIGKMIADNQKKQEDANQAAIDGTNALMSAEDKYWANKRKNEKKASEETEQASVIREETTRQFMIFERDRAVEAMSEKQKASFLTGARMEEFTRDPEYQKKIQAIIAEDMKKNPEAGAAAVKDSNFQGPQGFSNVIGVGANPVLENMTRQTDIQSQILEILKNSQTDRNPLSGVDFTKKTK
jgi:hypothetical protein